MTDNSLKRLHRERDIDMASITSSSGISGLLGQFSGIGSEQIDKLLEADAIPKMRVQNRITEVQGQKTAWSDIKTRLTNLMKRVEDLQKPATFQSKKITNSDDKSVTISGTASAAEGNYQLKIDQLATSSSLRSTNRQDSSTNALRVSGELRLTTAELNEDGTAKEFTFDITSGDSLKAVADKINAQTKDSNITANIIDNQLVLTDKKTGERQFSVSGSAASSLGLDSENLTAGQDAKFTLNGIEVTRQSNTVDDVVDGVTFNLLQTTESNVSLSLKNDTSKIKTAVKEFVTQYNSLMSLVSEKSDVGDPSAEGNTTGALSGDTTLTRLQTELRNMVAPSYTLGSDLRAFQVGISISDRQGTLALDETKLDEMLAKDPQAVQDFFYKTETVDGEKKTSGYSENLRVITDKYLSEKSENKGILATKFDSYEATIKDLNRQMTRIDEMIEVRKARYVDMFSRLDQAMMKAEEQMGFLINQINSFNGGN